MTVVALLYLLTTASASPLEVAQVWVESRGTDLAVGARGERGRLQIAPWSTAYWPPLLHLPRIGQIEGRRVLARWTARAGGDVRRGLAAYNCGNAGLRGRCGQAYAAEVLKTAAHQEEKR